MPQRNSIKVYGDNSYYHIYNRGVEKRQIFMDEADYGVFLSYLKESLTPLNTNLQGGSLQTTKRRVKNFHGQIELACYCLMPNHFHLLIKQIPNDAMEHFMRSVSTRYSMYFNKRYGRVGKLFESHYKAILVNEDKYLIHLSRYIHVNPYPGDIVDTHSSYACYLGIRNSTWVNTKLILDMFNNPLKDPVFQGNTSYKDFVESDAKSEEFLGKLTLERNN